MKEAANGLATSDLSQTPGKPGRVRSGRRGPFQELGAGASAQARQQAAAILEVLAGVRTPTQAAEALAVSLPRYYLLETRALQGMLLACEPRRLGRQATAESALAALGRECEQLRRECARQQALVRAAQRTIGLTAAKPVTPSKPGAKRRRRPTARALRAAARLQTEDAPSAAEPARAGAAV
jgi:hypothetical protein